MKSGVLLALAVVIIFCIPPANAQETEVIHFQGMLTGPDGGPLRTDIYNVDFSIWDHATDGLQALWSETQTVEVTEGLFDVFLGEVNPLNPDVFTPEEAESELRFLEIQVEGDDPMTPRLQMGKMPNSFISSRVLGDIETNTGLLRIHPPDPAAPPAIEISADEIASGMIIVDDRQGEPGENTSIALSADGSFAKMIIVDDRPSGDSGSIDIGVDQAQTQMIIVDDRQGEPGENTSIALSADGSFAKMIIVDDKPDENRAVQIIADEVGSRLIIEDNIPGPDRTVKIGADEDATSLSFHISDTEVPVMNLRGDILGASLEMSGYETGQQIGPLLEMNADANGADFAMAAPGMGGAGAEITDPIIQMVTDASGGNFKINWAEPLDVPSPAIEMAVNNVSGEANFRLTEPLDIPAPAIEMSTDGSANSIIVNWTEPLDTPSPAIEMMANGINNSLAINWTEPLDMPSPAVELNASDVANNITLNWTEPLDMPSPAIEMSTAPASGATYRMFQPQPEPPGEPIIEFNVGLEGNGSMRMFQPQPEPPGSDPIIEMLVGSSGGNFMMYGQQAALTSTPFCEISSYSSGADMKFFESAGGTTVEINSAGDVIAQRGTFGPNNTNNVTGGLVSGGNNSLYGSYSAIVGGYGNNVTTAAEYSCLVGVDAILTADSTFMVDMPHIHFGDGTDGYEFPIEDGRPNQFLATNGSGQLSWVDVTLLAQENARRLIEENRELKDMISQLESRIAELEDKVN